MVPLSYASASAVLNMLTFSPDYSPKTLWRLERDGYTVECILLPRAPTSSAVTIAFTRPNLVGGRTAASSVDSTRLRLPNPVVAVPRHSSALPDFTGTTWSNARPLDPPRGRRDVLIASVGVCFTAS
jgi:hypothetical protein